MLRLAHRGDWRRAPENTLPALRAALEVPACDGLEFDVRLASDGVPVLLHDETLARVQGRPEPVGELRARALEDLGVPSLADVLAAIPHRAFLDVELKGRHDRAVVEVLAAGRGPGLVNAVVSPSTPTPWSASRASSPPGRAGSTPGISSQRRSRWRPSSSAARSPWSGTRSIRIHGAGPRRGPGGRGLDRAPARHGGAAGAARDHREQRRGGRARRVTAPRDIVRRHLRWRRILSASRPAGSRGAHDGPGGPRGRGRGHGRRLGVGLRRGGRCRARGRPRAGSGRRRCLVPRGRHRPRPGRHARDGRARALVDRLLPGPGDDLRHRFRLSRARLPDPGGHRGGRAARAGAHRDAAWRRPHGRPLARRRRGGGDGRHARAGWSPGRQLPRWRRPHRPAAQRPCLLARDGGRRGRSSGSGRPSPACARATTARV